MKLSVLAVILLTLGFITNVAPAQAADASIICSFSYDELDAATDMKTFSNKLEALGFSREGRVTNANYSKSTPDYIYHAEKPFAKKNSITVIKTLFNPTALNWKDTPFAADIKSIKDRYCATANASPKSYCNDTEKTFNLSLSYVRTPPLSNCNLLVGYADGQLKITYMH